MSALTNDYSPIFQFINTDKGAQVRVEFIIKPECGIVTVIDANLFIRIQKIYLISINGKVENVTSIDNGSKFRWALGVYSVLTARGVKT